VVVAGGSGREARLTLGEIFSSGGLACFQVSRVCD
jgi:hypothetical protein